jgi:pimeloyl-ACP methyl ester carboxylesterase
VKIEYLDKGNRIKFWNNSGNLFGQNSGNKNIFGQHSGKVFGQDYGSNNIIYIMKDRLIIIHGWTKEGSDSFSETVKFLKDTFEIYLIDLPGFKKPLERPYSFDDYLNYLETQINTILTRTYADFTRTDADKIKTRTYADFTRTDADKIKTRTYADFTRTDADSNLSLRKSLPAGKAGASSLRESASFYLLGHSFGGALAMLYALKHPEKIKKLILYNPAIIREKNLKIKISLFLSKIFKFLAKIIPEKFFYFSKKAYYRFIVKSYDYFNADENLKKTFSNIVKVDLKDLAKNLKVKTILLWSKNDKFTPLRHGKILKNLISDSQLILLDGGHSFHKEKPEEFAKILKQIIEDTNRQ